ncbi:MAG: hypothetical protein JST69_06310 [Bacteroidetes bacterium]|nr:hypothetical protein [Bacteroidota bacterium]
MKPSKINGGIAIYYGISGIVLAIAGVISTGIWLFKTATHQTDFSWGTLLGLILAILVMGSVGYAILRVGYEEIEK